MQSVSHVHSAQQLQQPNGQRPASEMYGSADVLPLLLVVLTAVSAAAGFTCGLQLTKAASSRITRTSWGNSSLQDALAAGASRAVMLQQ